MKSVFETESGGQKKYPSLKADLETEIAVVGGGAAGLLCAYLLSEKGFKVTLLEAGRLASGTSSKSTSTLTALQSPMYKRLIKKNKHTGDYLEAQKEALNLYKQIIDENKIECDFQTLPAYLYATDKKSQKKLQKEFKAMSRLTKDIEYTQSEFGPAIKMDGQGQFNLPEFLHALPKKFEVYENTRIVDFILDKKTLKTQAGQTIKAEKIVIATRFPAILNNFYYLKMYQSKSYVITFKHPPLNAMYCGAGDSSLYMRSYGGYMVLGGFDHRTGKHKKCANYYNKLKESAQSFFNVKESDFGEFWSAEDAITFDSLPFAGRLSKKHPCVYLLTGFNEWGVLNSMICARVVANLIAQKGERYKEIFSPRRPYLRKNMGAFLHHGLIAAGSLFRGLFQGKRSCRHIGCGLRYNRAENVYECPCHGSRYSRDGSILDGPSVKSIPPRRSPKEINIRKSKND